MIYIGLLIVILFLVGTNLWMIITNMLLARTIRQFREERCIFHDEDCRQVEKTL